MFKVTVKNRPEVLRALAKVDRRIVEGVALAILNGGAAIAADARSRAPVDTGALRASIQAEATQTKDGLPAARVYTNLFYARFVEFGTRASVRGQVMLDGSGRSWGKAGKSKRRKTRIKGVKARIAARTHPGSRARPFLYPAYKARKTGIQNGIAGAIASGAASAKWR